MYKKALLILILLLLGFFPSKALACPPSIPATLTIYAIPRSDENFVLVQRVVPTEGYRYERGGLRYEKYQESVQEYNRRPRFWNPGTFTYNAPLSKISVKLDDTEIFSGSSLTFRGVTTQELGKVYSLDLYKILREKFPKEGYKNRTITILVNDTVAREYRTDFFPGTHFTCTTYGDDVATKVLNTLSSPRAYLVYLMSIIGFLYFRRRP